jgi:hypothetical protein
MYIDTTINSVYMTQIEILYGSSEQKSWERKNNYVIIKLKQRPYKKYCKGIAQANMII